MGLDVELIRVTQVGTSRRRRQEDRLAIVGDPQHQFIKAVERAQHRGSTPMLDRVDIYRTLELSWDEMPQFLDELDQLLAVTTDHAERDVLEAVHLLAVRCRDEQRILRLVGD